MRRIAAVVGVSGAALYVYFSDKEAILLAIAKETFAELLAALEASQCVGGDPLQRFRAGLMTYIAFGQARPDEYRLTFQRNMISAPAPGRKCGDIEAADRSFSILERGVAELMDAGIFHRRSSVPVGKRCGLVCTASRLCCWTTGRSSRPMPTHWQRQWSIPRSGA